MALSYAGIPLDTITPQAAAWAANSLHLDDLPLFQHRAVKSQTLPRLPIPQSPSWYRARLGTLHWPTGASQFGVGLFLVSGAKLSAIRALVYASTYTPQTLVMSDGATRNIATSMWMLPSWPVVRVPTKPSMHLLILVDDRYWWWTRNVTLSVVSNSTSWASLYSTIGTALGVTVAVDTVPAAYLKPGLGWNTTTENAAQLLDAVAYSVGQRVVRKLNGTVSAVNYDTANTTQTANLAISNIRLTRGSNLDLDTTDLPGLIPTKISIHFPNLDDGTSQLKNRTLSAPKNTETKVFRSTGLTKANGELVWIPAADVTSYTNQFGDDWYNWQKADSAYTWVGSPDWTPGGLESYIEWDNTSGDIVARVIRRPYNDLTEDLVHAAPQTQVIKDIFGNVSWNSHTTTFKGLGGNTVTLTPGVNGNDSVFVDSSTTSSSSYSVLYSDSIKVSTITVTGPSYHTGPESYTGGFLFPQGSVSVPAGTTNNLLRIIKNSIIDLTPAGAATITGMCPGDDGDGTLLYIINTSDSYPVTLNNEDGSSSTTCQFSIPSDCNVTINPGYTIPLKRDGITGRWRALITPSCATLFNGCHLTSDTITNVFPAGSESVTFTTAPLGTEADYDNGVPTAFFDITKPNIFVIPQDGFYSIKARVKWSFDGPALFWLRSVVNHKHAQAGYVTVADVEDMGKVDDPGHIVQDMSNDLQAYANDSITVVGFNEGIGTASMTFAVITIHQIH